MAKLSFLKQIRKESNDINYSTSFENDILLNEKTFKDIFDHHPDAVFTLDVNGKIKYFNVSVKKIFGYTDRDLSGNCERFFYKSNKTLRKKYFHQALKGKAQNYQTVILHKNGSLINVDTTYIPILDNDMKVIGVYGVSKDITVHVQRKEEINKIKNSLELAQQVGRIGSFDYDIIEDEAYWSNQMYKLYGIENTIDFVPTLESVTQLVHPEDQENYQKEIIETIEKGKNLNVEYRILRRDGTSIYVIVQADIILDENQVPIRLIGTMQDITPRKMAENKLIESEHRFQNIYNHLEVGIWSFDLQKNTFIFATPGIVSVTGYSSEDFQTRITWEEIIHPDDFPTYSKLQYKLEKGESIYHHYRIIHKSGEAVWVQDQTLPALDANGHLIRIDGIVTNITEQKEYEERIEHLAYHDQLTDLPNRALFENKIQSLIELSKGDRNVFSIMYLGLDRFRNINESLGHVIGDKLLQEFSKRISSLLEKNSLIARMGGDEFGIVLWDYDPSDYPVTIAKTIIDRLHEPFFVEDFEFIVTASIGISTFPTNGSTVEELMKSADAALYRAKDRGKDNYQIYASSLNISSYKLYYLERDLRKSIDSNQLVVYFQPRVEASTGKIKSAEALIRWEHPVWGLVSPIEFIPLAEETGFINEISDWVLKQVCHYIKAWQRENHYIVPISINVSAQRFLKNDWKSTIVNVLKETGIDPSLIEIEITETTLIQHEEIVESAIQFLKELGIKIALDDFGTGYSSLTYIKKYPIDTIKIDQSFIKQITKANNDEIIIKSVIFLAKGLNLNIVAEGVETTEQLAFLRQQECHEIQGYIFSKPVPEEKFKSLLKRVILKPNSFSNIPKIIDRRSYYRINMLFPLSAYMSLIFIQGKKVELGKTEVLIEDIGPGGIRFLSNIHLPIRPDITFQLETTIMGQRIILNGHIVWKEEVKGIFQYGLQFSIDEHERDCLIKNLNHFSLHLRNNPFVPDCSFIKEDKISYLKKLKTTE